MPRCMTSTSPSSRSARRYFARRPSATMRRPGQPLGEARRETGSAGPAGAASTRLDHGALHDRLEAAADGFDFGKFGHGIARASLARPVRRSLFGVGGNRIGAAKSGEAKSRARRWLRSAARTAKASGQHLRRDPGYAEKCDRPATWRGLRLLDGDAPVTKSRRTHGRRRASNGRDPSASRSARREAGAGRRRVRNGRPPLRPDERPDVRRPAPRSGRTRWSPRWRRPGARRPSGCSTWPAAPATSPSASSTRPARAPRRPSPTSTPRCWRSAASAPSSAGLADRVDFVEAQCRGAAVRRRPLRRLHHRLRHPQRAAHRPALAEAYRVLKPGGRFLCLEFSAVDVPGLDRIYDLYSFNVIPALGKIVAGDGRALPLSRRIDPPLPQPGPLRRHDPRRRLRARHGRQPSPAGSRRSIPAGSSDGADVAGTRRRAGCRHWRRGLVSRRPRAACHRPSRPPRPRRLRLRPRGRLRHRRPSTLPPGAVPVGSPA